MMYSRGRRKLLVTGLGTLVLGPLAQARILDQEDDPPSVPDASLTDAELRDQWMSSVTSFRDLGGNLVFSRFVEPMYFLMQPIGWSPSGKAQEQYQPVQVPIGFVTDLASIPRPFWSFLPRDGNYTYAAILHDYLYWDQSVTREAADNIFRFAMADLNISDAVISLIYTAVRAGGQGSWDKNRALKIAGEKRILRRFPEQPTIRWVDWKERSDVFA